MARTVQDILNLIREHDIKMIDFKMVDINGQYRHVTIPACHFSEKTLTGSIGFVTHPTMAMPWLKRATWYLYPSLILQ